MVSAGEKNIFIDRKCFVCRGLNVQQGGVGVWRAKNIIFAWGKRGVKGAKAAGGLGGAEYLWADAVVSGGQIGI